MPACVWKLEGRSPPGRAFFPGITGLRGGTKKEKWKTISDREETLTDRRPVGPRCTCGTTFIQERCEKQQGKA